MTDDELGRKITEKALVYTSLFDGEQYERIGRAARELLEKPAAMIDEKSVRNWYRRLPQARQYDPALDCWHAVQHFAPQYGIPPASPLPPICGMSGGDLLNEFLREKEINRTHRIHELDLDLAARVAHRLAQPAPVEDDTDARMCAFAFYKATEPAWDERDCAEAWDREPPASKQGWRAVVAAVKKGVGDE